MKRFFGKIGLALALVTAMAVPALAEKTMDTDVAIVGAGTSGLAAAVEALQGGAKVIVLEKQPKVGGTGSFCEGVFAAESKIQKRIGIDVSKSFAFKLIMNYSHWKANGALAKAFVDKSAETIDWLDNLGVKIEYVGVGGFGGPLTWHVIAPGPDLVKDPRDFHCQRMINVFNKYVLDHGGKILLETPGTGLITENGKVVGVFAKDKSGEKIRINAKAVVIATGGFANNKEMMRKYVKDYPDVIPVGQIGKDGDGIRMAEAAGAALEGMSTVQAYRPGLAGFHPADQMIALAVQPYFWVTPRGERYTDESSIEYWPYAGNALTRVGGTAYSIYDDATRKFAVEKGIEMPLGEWVLQGTKLTKWEDAFNKELARKRGNVFKADTLEDLAKQLGMDAAVLKASVEKMNKAAATREDSEFNKQAKFLRPIATPPFYATKLLPRHLGTLGGVKVTAEAEAVNTKGAPIPGLYAVGTDSGGMYGDSYDLLLGGGTAGYAVNSGRIAAENALKYAGITK
ncbi:FAD-dependent oxidoreductase [Geobacter sp. AOG2]|uniref:FAD-dependent oxidoreductase n=1 Tax=Geobacter sp. AOG2 TaxID=1566347 RepID=UPI001CC81826|nr:FAD-dependent oxidoreductase [Geobacter sp. AOG2]GFE62064.1 fumarate reductase [Geobacter sp. AOG2]